MCGNVYVVCDLGCNGLRTNNTTLVCSVYWDICQLLYECFKTLMQFLYGMLFVSSNFIIYEYIEFVTYDPYKKCTHLLG